MREFAYLNDFLAVFLYLHISLYNDKAIRHKSDGSLGSQDRSLNKMFERIHIYNSVVRNLETEKEGFKVWTAKTIRVMNEKK